MADTHVPHRYKGVTWDRVKRMWRVRLCLQGGARQHVGYYTERRRALWRMCRRCKWPRHRVSALKMMALLLNEEKQEEQEEDALIPKTREWGRVCAHRKSRGSTT